MSAKKKTSKKPCPTLLFEHLESVQDWTEGSQKAVCGLPAGEAVVVLKKTHSAGKSVSTKTATAPSGK